MTVYHPYLYMKIGDFIVTPEYDPKYVTDFSIKRLKGIGGEALDFNVYDDTALEFEFQLLQGHRNIQGSYGLNSINIFEFDALVTSWKMSFRSIGCVLAISATNKGIVNMDSTKSCHYSGTPADVIKQVIKDEKLECGYIEPMADIPHSELPEDIRKDCVEVPRVFHRNGLSALAFIESLLPYCRSALNGKTGFVMYFQKENDVLKFYCHLPETTKKNSVTHVFTVGSDESNVTSFSLNTNLYPFRRGVGVKIQYHDANGNLQSVSAGGVDKLPTKAKSVTSVEQVQTHVSNVASLEEAQVLADYMWSLKLLATMQVEMTVVDYGKFINIMDNVEVFVYVGPTSSRHYSSGMYFVSEVTDSINDGHLYTSLKLISLQM